VRKPPGPTRSVCHGHCLNDVPRVTTPPWKLEAWGTTHVSFEIMTALPDSTVMPPAEMVTRAGPLIVTNRRRRWWQTCSSLCAIKSSLARSPMASAVSNRLGVPRTKATGQTDGRNEDRSPGVCSNHGLPLRSSPKGCRHIPEKAFAGPPERQFWSNLALRRPAECDAHHTKHQSATAR
jgi:hypothetical protein